MAPVCMDLRLTFTNARYFNYCVAFDYDATNVSCGACGDTRTHARKSSEMLLVKVFPFMTKMIEAKDNASRGVSCCWVKPYISSCSDSKGV